MGYESEYNFIHKRIHLSKSFSVSLEFLGYVEYNPSEQGLEHKYPEWSYSYVENNNAIFYFDGKQITVQAGNGLFIPPFLKHHIYSPGPNQMKLLYFGFNGNLFLENDDIFVFNEKIAEYSYLKTFNQTLSQLIKELILNKDSETLFSFSGIILENLLKISNLVFVPKNISNSPELESKLMIYTAKTILSKDLSKNISLCELSKYLYISEKQLAKLFYQITGMYFKDYCLMLKMEHASRLLCTTNKSILEIALELGFCDVYYFSRRFKEYFNCSPGKLRKTHE